MMDRLAIQACEEATHAGYPLDVGAALIVELDGPAAECEQMMPEVEAICRHARLERHPHRGVGRPSAS